MSGRKKSKGNRNKPQQDSYKSPDKLRSVYNPVEPWNEQQELYMRQLRESDMTIAIGSAGSGKTLLAIDAAISKLINGEIQHIYISSPAIDREGIGAKPGDVQQKLYDNLRQLYDGLNKILPHEACMDLFNHHIIDIVQLGTVDGLTINDFLIVDEAQHLTPEQAKVVATRLGEEGHVALTGAAHQSVPSRFKPGISYLLDVIHHADLPGHGYNIGITEFEHENSVRHPLVGALQQAFEDYDTANPDGQLKVKSQKPKQTEPIHLRVKPHPV